MKRKMRRLACWLLLSVLLLCGCAEGGEPKTSAAESDAHKSLKERVFRVAEMEISLDESFAQAPVQGLEACYTSEHVDVFVLREDFSLAEGLRDQSLLQYGAAVVAGNEQAQGAAVTEKNGLTYFEYAGEEGGVRFVLLSYLYKSENAFWVVQFATPEAKRAYLEDSVEAWAKSVRFTESLDGENPEQ